MRLFVGLPVPEGSAEELRRRAEAILGRWDRARLTAAEDLHVTLRFLGEVGEERARALEEALGRVQGGRVELRLEGVGVFRGAGVVYAAVTPERGLVEMEERVSEELARRGVPRELRRFTPHVTMARMRHGLPGGELERWAAMWEPMQCPVDAVVLYQSVGAAVERGAGRYRRLRQWPLRG